MTVLGDNQAAGHGPGAVRTYLGAVALAIVGITVAYGLSRMIDDEQASVESGPAVERSVAMADNVHALRERTPSPTQGASSAWTLEQELAQIRSGGAQQVSSRAPASEANRPR